MPSRFAFYSTPEYLADTFGVSTEGIDFYEYYNLKPTNRTTGMVLYEGEKQIVRMRWGFVGGKKFFKARAEEAHEKRMFKNAIRERRSLIFANGFFEWDKEDKESVPHYFTIPDQELFCIGGLYNAGVDKEDGLLRFSTAVLTVDANDVVSQIFHRMPLIIPPDAVDLWLDPTTPFDQVQDIIQPFPSNKMTSWEVESLPSRGDNGPDTIKPKSQKSTSLDDFF
ncbi:MAG: SOS response-associated peptidase [Candidatus Kariarchaeaceae archaeon]|jgi:putative SOS response-associated peptidase YedK